MQRLVVALLVVGYALLCLATARASTSSSLVLTSTELQGLAAAAAKAGFEDKDLPSLEGYVVEIVSTSGGVEVLFLPNASGKHYVTILMTNGARVESSPSLLGGNPPKVMPGITAAELLKALHCAQDEKRTGIAAARAAIEVRPGFAFVSFIPLETSPLPSDATCAGNCDKRTSYTVKFDGKRLICTYNAIL